jgi:hypothetical protein
MNTNTQKNSAYLDLIAPKNGKSPHGSIVGQGEFKYKVDCLWGLLDESKYPVENCHSVDIDSQNRIVMVTDNPKNNVIIYNQQGEYQDSWGTMFPGAHAGKIVNENGEDFIYIVDSGWKLNSNWDGVSTDKWDSPFNKVIAQSGFIAKLTLTGQLVFTISHPQTIDIYTPDMPFRPTDIAIAPNGDLYVIDGYGSDYVIQYDSQGRYIRHWGGHNNKNTHYNLSNVHGIEFDYRDPTQPKLMIGSRAEQTIKSFSLDGTYLHSLHVPGAWIHAPIVKNDYFYSPVCWSDIDGKNVDASGFISIFNKEDKLVANIGGTQPNYIHGQLQTVTSTWDVFTHCHGLCVDNNENLYIAQWNTHNSYPWKLERQ